ncbi:MAG: secondary thiamine-phosphate synthase enzyme YjbQ [Halobacteria archaeon]|nr:secondary thiamine-phosphate synthase enzyme YjbQ [Halobacteria archaeon]
MTTRFELSTDQRVEIVDITSKVSDVVDIDDGICIVFVKHTTAGLTVNEKESRLVSDIEEFLKKAVPENDGYAHDEIDDNADAHLRSMLLNTSLTIPVENGDLALGTWQSILFFEGDGPRQRTVTVKTIGQE